MKTKTIYRVIFGALLLPLTFACQRQELIPSDASSSETTETSEATDEEFITPKQPIVLELGVTLPQVVDPAKASTRAQGDLSRDYTDIELAHASINTTKKEDVSTGNTELDKFIKENWEYLNGYDYVSTLTIPELRPEDYKVEGLVQRITVDTDGKPVIPGEVDPSSPISRKVTLTLYRLPKKGVITFLANNRVFQSFMERDQHMGYLDLENPYSVTMSSDWQLTDVVRDEFKTNGKNYDLGKSRSKNFIRDYLPMFGRLYNAQLDEAGSDLLGSWSSTEAPKKIDRIYLERAVSVAVIHWEHERTEHRDMHTDDGIHYYYTPYFQYSGEYFFHEIDKGLYCNLTSIVPNNWSGILAKAATHMTFDRVPQPDGRLAFYRHLLDGDVRSELKYSSVLSALQRSGTQWFFMPENFPKRAADQNTIYVQLTQFESIQVGEFQWQYRIVGEPRAKKFDLPFGEKNPTTGLYDIHRNTIYNILLKLKKTPQGVVPYVVAPWHEVNIDTEL